MGFLTDSEQGRLIDELWNTTAKLKGGVKAIFQKYGIIDIPAEALAEVAAATKQADMERRRNPRSDGLEKRLDDLTMHVRRIIDRNVNVDNLRGEREGVVKRGVIQILTGIGWIKK
jgi:hypothetical protein